MLCGTWPNALGHVLSMLFLIIPNCSYGMEKTMPQKYVSNKVAPFQYAFRRLNSKAGQVIPGWGTAPLMGVMLVLLLLFILTILQLYNGTILVEGVNLN